VFRNRFRAVFDERGIAVVTGAAVKRVEAGRLILEGRASIEADEILWTTEAAPGRWLAKTGLPIDERGFLKFDRFTRCCSTRRPPAACSPRCRRARAQACVEGLRRNGYVRAAIIGFVTSRQERLEPITLVSSDDMPEIAAMLR
jgi:hypothetical protein